MTEPYTPKTELNETAQRFIAEHEARRAPERPRDAVMGELHQAYRGAFSSEATADQNHIAGIIAAHTKAVELVDSKPDDPAAMSFAQESLTQISTIKDQVQPEPVIQVDMQPLQAALSKAGA